MRALGRKKHTCFFLVMRYLNLMRAIISFCVGHPSKGSHYNLALEQFSRCCVRQSRMCKTKSKVRACRMSRPSSRVHRRFRVHLVCFAFYTH